VNQYGVPIIEALENYHKNAIVRFHMPGHKGNICAEEGLARLLGTEAFRLDVTNIPEMDNLHQPRGVIKEAEQLAAEAFGADRTYFLINGSSCGLQALIMTVCDPGDRILVPRNIHRSILGGIILSGAIPIFYLPSYDPEFGIPLGCLPEVIEQYLTSGKPVKAVLIVNPTYHGITSDVARIADIAHKHAIPLLVDEAHGPHLRFHENLPASSLQQGADAVVHGTHKLLTSFTQSSMLHTKGRLVDCHRLEAVLRILQSTSTSYLLLASLDAARASIQANGRKMIAAALENSQYIRERVQRTNVLKTYGKEIIGKNGISGLDLTKVTISCRQVGMSGYQMEKILRDNYNIQVEMADLFNILLLVTAGNNYNDIEAISCALDQLVNTKKYSGGHTTSAGNVLLYPEIPEMVLSPREAFFSPVIAAPIENAVGKVSAEIITCYPPGVPIVGPGELITQEIIEYMLTLKATGASFQGCHDPLLERLLVVS
jgi:lysine decarboxylase